MNWKKYIEYLRKLETEIAFKYFSSDHFNNGLELGAGVGSQSLLLKKYVKNLISTDLDPNRLKLRGNINGITYKICDAEKTSDYFKPNSFDLVFASNLFEHLPNPTQALKEIKKVIKPDGLVILVMPSSFWAIQKFILHYPFIIIRKFKKNNNNSVKLIKTSSEFNTNRGNNLKASEYKQNRFLRKIHWPQPHGVSNSNFEEFLNFRKKYWLSQFETSGFRIINIEKGPVMSGRGMGLNRIRKLLQMIGLTGEYIYYLKVK